MTNVKLLQNFKILYGPIYQRLFANFYSPIYLGNALIVMSFCDDIPKAYFAVLPVIASIQHPVRFFKEIKNAWLFRNEKVYEASKRYAHKHFRKLCHRCIHTVRYLQHSKVSYLLNLVEKKIEHLSSIEIHPLGHYWLKLHIINNCVQFDRNLLLSFGIKVS